MYKTQLPLSFPHHVIADPDKVYEITTLLMDPDRRDVPSGSSFAVTVDPTPYNHAWNLWLSEVSHKYLERLIDEGSVRQEGIYEDA